MNLDFECEFEDLRVRESFKHLSNVLETGVSQTVKNEKLGDVLIDKGLAGKNGYGLLHIIETRTKEGKTYEETIAIIHLVIQAAKKGNINRSITDKNDCKRIRRIELEKKRNNCFIEPSQKQ